MIPHLVAGEIRETLLDYLRSTWQLADRDLERALLAFLKGDRGMFKGPWVRLGLPFSLAPDDAAIPLDVKPAYRPYLHQLLAWQRLSSRHGHEPEATIVTTGTGSGKTECFLYPILDHALRALNRREKGIQAIMLYPMNALAADQARRMAAIVHGDERLRGRLRIGMFVGGKGQHREMGPAHCIDDNSHMLRNPPDILLTNYRMLDLLLQRPSDAGLWAHNSPGRLRYLVLDELHTYDGAQGTDVACLVRRLGARLGGAESICPVGTSATVSGGAGTTRELLEFAERVFDQTFSEESLVGESRLSATELFEGFGAESPESEAGLPADANGLLPAPQEEADAHVRAVARAWFGGDPALEGAAGEDFRLRLGEATMRHPAARALVRTAAQRLLPWEVVCREVRAAVPALSRRTEADAEALLASLLSMIAWSKRLVGARRMPLVSVQVQLWVREVRRLLRDVTAAGEVPRFRWVDDGPPPDGTLSLPMAYCRDCGHAGWVTTTAPFGPKLEHAYAEIARAVQERSTDVRYLHHDASVREDDGAPPARKALDLAARELFEVKDMRPGRVALFVEDDGEGSTGRGQQKCPACGAREAMRLLASRSASLTSVAVGHLFTTPLNTDRKLLAFSDSVQDASHRAGFFGGRTYRFALRSAILAVVPAEGAIPLASIGPAMAAHWPARVAEGRWDEASAFVGAFLPRDLEFLESNVQWEQALEDHEARTREAEKRGEPVNDSMPRPSDALVSDVAERLRWEATRELGVASRIGRTLEQSGCLAVTVDPARFAWAAARSTSLLPEKLGVLQGVPAKAFAHLLSGLVTRLRLRGGVLDPFLERYVESGGSGFHLSKQMAPLLSPFGQFTSKPTFLTSEPKPRPRQFDSLMPAEKRTWFTDFATRALGVELDPDEVRDLGAALAPILVQAEILGERTMTAKHKAWGLLPDALWVSRAHVWRRCGACGNVLATVAGSVTDPLGAPCLRARCDGRYESVSEAEERTATYYRRYYARGALGRVFPREHTGLLGREEREGVEIEFKERPRPNAANLLSCTPTLEMGIDIGDLSATLLCSVPPSPASYIQRVGRAGRETGNALLVSFAATRPHDLYYFEDPLAVMAGAIHPPGCFLDAPEVLKRQALAFCFDRLAKDGHKMGGRLREALRESTPLFPERVLAAIAERRASLKAGFLELFARQLTPESRKRIEDFFEPESDGLAPVERRLADEIRGVRAQRDELRNRVDKLSVRIEKLRTDDAEKKKLEDPDRELEDLQFEKSYAWAELKGLLDQDIWQFLCDRSALPNYAFPEAGVKLDAYVRREGAAQEVEQLSWVRPPASAIAELAPFNTFYGSARRVTVQNIDLKHGGAPGQWQLCKECHHMAEVAKQPDPMPASCPACGADGWNEVGRRKWLAPMTHVRAFARHRDATVGDESEDRDRAYYEAHNFYDPAETKAIQAWMNRDKGFGFELLPRLTLRRINFGPRDPKAPKVHVAGRDVPEVGFEVCTDCGQVQHPDGRAPDPSWPEHWTTCPRRRMPRDKQSLRAMHLVRKLESEALRMVVPISDHEWDRRLPNLRGALRLGLRRYFGGDPDFLLVDSYDEPLPGLEGRRRYLVVLDLVPGGTGMLVDLANNKGARLKQVLLLAKEALEKCPCNARPDVKACHLCLYAYREQDALPLLDRDVAREEVDRLLDGFEGLSLGDTVASLAQESVLESELERRFVRRIEDWVREQQGTKGDVSAASFERQDEGSWRLVVGGRAWKVRAQVRFDEDQAEHRCEADFVFSPEVPERGVVPVAVFTDGAAYHVRPRDARGRIEDDLRKRLGLSRAGRFLTWSITWRDVNESETNKAEDRIQEWWPDAAFRSQIGKLAVPLKLDSILGVLDRDPLTSLFAHLKEPGKLQRLAALAAFILLHQRGKQLSAGAAAGHHDDAREAAVPSVSPAEAAAGSDTLLAKAVFGGDGEGLIVVSAPREAFATLTGNPERAAVTLRLDDRAERRKTPTFQIVWRQALRAWNLLQALPGAVVVTTEQLTDFGVEEGTVVGGTRAKVLSEAPPRRMPSVAPAGALSVEAEGILAEIRDVGARAAVRAALSRGAESPRVPYEVTEGLKGMIGEIEVGWPGAQVGLYFDDQREAAERLRSRGWVLFPIEAGVSEGGLLQALRIEEA